MSVFIADLELSQPLPNLTLPEGATGLMALMRWHKRPVGLVRLDNLSGCVTSAQLEAARLAQGIIRENQPEQEIVLNHEIEPLSIVICTRERPADLQRCLPALLPMAMAGHEVLVVDNAPQTRRTAEIVAHYPYRYLCEPRPGLNHARNRGLQAASHSIVAFTDDDAVADSNWLNALAQSFHEAKVGCVTGLVLPLELETAAQQAFENYYLQRRTFSRQIFSASDLRPASAGVVGVGANMAVRRDLALALGGFDPRLDAGTRTCSGGDTDMFARILAAGAEIVYTPAALVWHRHRRSEAELRKCIFGYGVGLYSFLTKRVIEEKDAGALIIALRWLVGPFVKAARRRLLGQATPPLSLLLHEAGGAFLGPFRFWQETHHYKTAIDKLTVNNRLAKRARVDIDREEVIHGNQSTFH